jgi:hypothetical protein
MKVKLKKKNQKKSKTKDRLEEYFSSLDFTDLWESFSTDCNENGTLKYATVWSFVKAKTKESWKQKFLYWILGPIGTSDEYKKYDQFDFDKRRENGHWYNSANASKLANEVKKHNNALESLREVGKVNISFISRLENLAKEIDREYSGRLFLPNLSAKENTLRAANYTQLLDRLQQMMGQAQIMYGRTQGMDLERLDQFFAMFGQGMGQAAAQMGLASGGKIIEGQTPASAAITKIADMIAQKAANFELELPDSDMNDIVTESMQPKLIKKDRIN